MASKQKLDQQYICDAYVVNNRSTVDIADELGTYANTIRRILVKNGIKMRSRSQAQKNNLDQNGHPLSGKKLSENEKQKISDSLRQYWDDMDDKTRLEATKKRSIRAKAQWENMSEYDQQNMLRNMHRERHKTIGKGSKNENAIAALLKDRGYSIAQRTNDYTPGNQFEIDICLPQQAIAIEVDGKTHYEPIFGEDQLSKVQATDKMKNSILLSGGFTVIRIQDKTNKHSLAACSRIMSELVDIIEDTSKTKQLYVLELK